MGAGKGKTRRALSSANSAQEDAVRDLAAAAGDFLKKMDTCTSAYKKGYKSSDLMLHLVSAEGVLEKTWNLVRAHEDAGGLFGAVADWASLRRDSEKLGKRPPANTKKENEQRMELLRVRRVVAIKNIRRECERIKNAEKKQAQLKSGMKKVVF